VAKASRVEVPEVLYDGSSGDPTLIAYDPGGVTGWALMQIAGEALTDPEYKIMNNVTHFSCGQFLGTEFSQVDQMVALAEDWPGAGLVIEDFILRKFDRGREVLSPVRITSAFRWAMSHAESYVEGQAGRMVRVQQPSLAMTTMTDDRLKALRYWERTTGTPHARDATRHVITFARRLKEDVRLRSAVFPALFLTAA
jgi:hypothetical protein